MNQSINHRFVLLLTITFQKVVDGICDGLPCIYVSKMLCVDVFKEMVPEATPESRLGATQSGAVPPTNKLNIARTDGPKCPWRHHPLYAFHPVLQRCQIPWMHKTRKARQLCELRIATCLTILQIHTMSRHFLISSILTRPLLRPLPPSFRPFSPTSHPQQSSAQRLPSNPPPHSLAWTGQARTDRTPLQVLRRRCPSSVYRVLLCPQRTLSFSFSKIVLSILCKQCFDTWLPHSPRCMRLFCQRGHQRRPQSLRCFVAYAHLQLTTLRL